MAFRVDCMLAHWSAVEELLSNDTAASFACLRRALVQSALNASLQVPVEVARSLPLNLTWSLISEKNKAQAPYPEPLALAVRTNPWGKPR